MNTLLAEPVLDFAPLLAGRHLISVSAGPNDDLILLSLTQEPDYRRGGSAKMTAKHPNEFHLLHIGDGWSQEIALTPTRGNFRHVQPVGGDLYLTVRAGIANDSDKNAKLFDTSGQENGAFPIGDGVEDIQADQSGNIWVSYFDQGIYGNSELAHNGLVCFDKNGQVLMQYGNLVTQHRLPVIDDCYALNVASKGNTWLYYYNAFPLVHLQNMKCVQMWKEIPVKGACAFAISGGRALFAGRYGDQKRLFLLSLDDEPQEKWKAKRFQPIDENGNAILFDRAFGRGSRMYLAGKECVWKIDLEKQ